MARLTAELPGLAVNSTEKLGVDPDRVEAMAFSWLTKRSLEGKPGNLPAATGARVAVVPGGIYAHHPTVT